MKNTPLSEKLILYFVLLGIGAILIISTVSFYSTKRALMSRTFDQLTSLRIVKKSRIEQFYADRVREISFLATTAEVAEAALQINRKPLSFISVKKRIASPRLQREGREAIPATGEEIGLKFGSLGEHFSAFFIFGRDGACMKGWLHGNPDAGSMAAGPLLPDSIYRLLRNKLISQPVVVCDVMLNNKTNQPFQLISSIIDGGRSGNTEFPAILALLVSTDGINSIMLNNDPLSGLGMSGETYLVGDDYLMRSTSRFLPGSMLKTAVKTQPVSGALAGREGTLLTNDYRTIPVLSSYGTISVPGLNWAILAEIDMQEAMIPIYETRTRILLLSTLIMLVFFAFVMIIAKRITKPLMRLKEAAIHLGEGQFGPELPVTTHDELGALTESFNIMARQIREKTTELQQERFGRMRSVIDGEEMERQRLSRELHDGIGQLLIAIKLRMESLLYQEGKDIGNSIQELKKYFDQIIDEVRRISNNLMPSVLEAFGITIALRNLFSETEEHSGLRIHFEAKGDYDDLDKKIKTYVYRLTQEAISNIVKHAEASEVRVNLTSQDESLLLVIRDNGKGFTPETAGKDGGNGIHNMRERASLLQGNIEIRSAPSKGTTITLNVPIIVTYVKNQDFPRG
ncbi:MAG: sensor histidine kinase [Bacteroidota bacterium]